MNTVEIHPHRHRLQGVARLPYSKPHMQRAILLSLLTNGPSVIVHAAWSSETHGLVKAAQQFGLAVKQREPDGLVATGVGRSFSQPESAIVAAGSAFNFRTAAALACLAPRETVIEGNAAMRRRPVVEYLNFIHDLGARVVDVSTDEKLRVRVSGGRRLGGRTVVDTRHSSQVLTAVLLIAPLADRPVTVECAGRDLVGEGYVDLTLAMMGEQGAIVARQNSSYVVAPGAYQSRVHHVASDFTALSYLAGALAVAPSGEITIADYYPSALSSEAQFLTELRRLGIQSTYDSVARSLHLQRTEPEAREVDIDGRNIPTVVPTIAAIAPFVDATVTVRNVAHVNNHKCRRVEVMIRELMRMGCRIDPLYRNDGALDGFSTTGRQRPAGGVELDSYGDHRIFMSLATAALGGRAPTVIDGVEHLHASFPNYLPVLAGLGARYEVSPPRLELASASDAI
jgi:3-phosphoshikimate 1-carboxyvinyltransferase